ncbi:TPA: hypothetical protein ACOEP1_004516 [Enterobacter kobei]|uniref:hypothetical protein n=1 Tax=Enterobacter kobei TaxID=208224 RepID=UPI0006671170|nr:hypothetical protein [Enterobacter kobei]CAE7591998.1 hypothetical protein AI2762V1_1185 [Enterobacter cloacae]CAH3573158.1 hypothetical protein AI2762V1_1185 [Enterobacter cloacae]HEG1994392.1 hypothetical protein [Enterobacter kobei]
MKFKGTRGPWHVMRGDVLDKNGRMVACIEGFCPGEIEIYDARLIAAAPDLLEALQKMFRAGQKQNWNEHYESEMNAARAAISKALGEE